MIKMIERLVIFLLFASGVSIAQAVNLPQTGQTTCFDNSSGAVIACAGTGQDGDILAGAVWPSPRFTTNPDTTLTDGLTGLVWTQDANAPGPSACANNGTVMTWQKALDHVACLNANSYLGHNDWRLPNVNELESLSNAEVAQPDLWLGAQGFTNVWSALYWSSTTHTVAIHWARAVQVSGYISAKIKKFTSLPVWPVRGTSTGPAQLWRTGQTACIDENGASRPCAGTGEDGATLSGVAWPAQRFADNPDQTVTDNLTALMWTQDANAPGPSACPNNGTVMTWQDALNHVACLNANTYLGYNDWRLPNRTELHSLTDFSQETPALLSGHPFTNLPPISGRYASSTSDPGSNGAAWFYESGDGTLISSGKASLSYVWPVRTGGTPPTPAPDITITDSVAPVNDQQIPFGDITELTSAEQTVTVTNDGNADLVLGSMAVANPLAAPFSLLNDSCSGQTLTPATSCSLSVRFSPLSIGSFNDSFDIPSNDPDENPVTVSVSGNGIGVTAPDISVTDTLAPVDDLQVPFGNVTEMTIADQVVTVTNDGNADLTIGSVASIDPLLAPFSVRNDSCTNQTLIPTANCTFSVRFEPTGTGSFSDSLDIPSNDADENPVTVSVSGTGTSAPVPDITVTDTMAPANDLQIPFADLTAGGSNDQTVTVINDGNADLVIGTVGQANALAAPFSLLNDACSGRTLAATASCTLDVRFAPTAAGTFNDSFDIASSDPDENPVTVNVSGTGLSAIGTATNNPPSTPGLVFPADGQQGLPVTVTLQWNPVTDPDGDTVSYDVYNCTDSDPLNNCAAVATNVAALHRGQGTGIYYAGLGLGGGIMILGITLTGVMRSRKQTVLLVAAVVIASLLSACFDGSSNNNSGSGNKTTTVSGLSAGSTYYWAVVAKDGNGGESPSVVRSYTTQ